jgi:hypothetical protein
MRGQNHTNPNLLEGAFFMEQNIVYGVSQEAGYNLSISLFLTRLGNAASRGRSGKRRTPNQAQFISFGTIIKDAHEPFTILLLIQNKLPR